MAKNQVSDVMVNMKAPISIITYFIGIIKNIASWIHNRDLTNFFLKKTEIFKFFFLIVKWMWNHLRTIKYFIGIIKNIASWIHKKMKPKKNLIFLKKT